MAIQPIDLQTLFSQLEKVSKTVSHQQQGIQVQNAIQQEIIEKRNTEKKQAVLQTASDEVDITKVKERKASSNKQENTPSDNNQKKREEEAPQVIIEVITDPNLGKHLDVSG